MSDLNTTLDALKFCDLRRVNVVGLSGSGKSTLARRLSDILQSPYVEMDRLFHGPNWTEPEAADFHHRVSRAVAGDRWILDGNYHSKTFDLKWKRATAIVWVNTSFIRNMWQSTTRAVRRAWSQEELWPGTGNRESFRKSFLSRDSVVLWALANYRRIQRRYSAVPSDPSWSHVHFIELRRRHDGQALLDRTEQLMRSADSSEPSASEA